MTDRTFNGPLRRFLDGLSVEVRARILAEVEIARLRNEELPEADAIMAELARGLRNSHARFERIGNPARTFFTPLEPFLVDGAPPTLRRGEIGRVSLSPIWAWLCRDLVPKEARRYSDQVKRALLARDAAMANALAKGFQDEALRVIESTIATSARDTISDRLTTFMGPPRAVDDLLEMTKVFKAREVLATLGAALPDEIADLSGNELDRTIAALDRVIEADVIMVLYGLIVVMRRLAMPWQLIRLAIRAAGSRGAARIADTRYAMAVGLVLRESEDLAARAREQFQEREAGSGSESVRRLSAAVQGLSELDIPPPSVWGKRLAALRGELAGLLRLEADVWTGQSRLGA